MTKKWNDLKRDLWHESVSGNPACGFCGQNAEDLHHALIGRMKGRPELDVRENALPVCKNCHRYADGYLMRNRAYNILCDELGQDRVDKWLDSLDFVTGEKFARE